VATTADFRNGMTLRIDGTLFSITEFQHVKPGKGGAFVRTKLKNVRTGAVLDRTLRSGERVEEVRLESTRMQYLYTADDLYYLMDQETYEQIGLAKEQLGEDVLRFLKEGETISALMDGTEIIGIDLPLFVKLQVAQTDPGVRGDTVSAGTKPAVLETGVTVQVPLFINVGDTLKIDTRTGIYVERA